MKFTKDDTKIIKGVAICLMLYHHLFAYPNKILDGISFVSLCSFGETTLSTYIGQFGRICMPMFLFMSGYGTYLSSEKCGDVNKMSADRIWGLYRSVWKVFILSLPVSAYFFGYERTRLIKSIIYNFLGLSCSFNEEWWFIVPFALLLILFPAIKRFLDRDRAGIFIDLLILTAYSAFYNYILPQLIKLPVFSELAPSVLWHKTNETLGILPAFVMGCLFAKYGLLDMIKERFAGKTPWCIIAFLCILALFYLHLYNYMYYDFINSAVFISCITVLLPLKFLKWPLKILEKIGGEATNIWLTHTFFSSYWCQRLIFAPKYSVLIFLLLLAVSYCASKLIKKFWNMVDGAFYETKNVNTVR